MLKVTVQIFYPQRSRQAFISIRRSMRKLIKAYFRMMEK